MSTVIDGYVTGTGNVTHEISTIHPSVFSSTGSLRGMAFTGNGCKITSALFYIQRVGSSSTAKFEVRIYEKPVGTNVWSPLSTVLAVSEQKVLDDFPVSFGWVSFGFTGVNQFKTVVGTTYLVSLLCVSVGLSDSSSVLPRLEIRLSDVVTTRRYVDYYSGKWESGTNFSYLFQVLGEPESIGTCDWNNVPFIHLKGDLVLDPAASTATAPQVLEILNGDPYEFKEWDSGKKGSIVAYLRTHLWPQIDHNWDTPKSAALKFTSLVNTTMTNPPLDEPNQKFSAYLSLVNFGVTSPNAGIACSRHFIVRKDLVLNGMLNCVEGAIVLHAGPYRKWNNVEQNPTIYTSENGHHVVDFLKFGSTTEFVPIRCGGLLDSNGTPGANGQVLTNTNSGLLWQNAVNVTSRIEKGQAQTNSNGDDVIVNFSPAFTNQPIITTGCLDASARSISVTITSLAGQPMNDLRAGFKIHASIATNDSHIHKQMSVGTRATLPSPNPANMIRSASIGDIEAVIYSIGTGGNGATHDVNTDSAAVSQVITRVPNLTLHYIAIGT